MITDILLVALGAAFIVIFFGRIGLRENIIARATKLVSELFDCDFCLSWWICVTVAVIAAIIDWDASILITPLFATPITRALL